MIYLIGLASTAALTGLLRLVWRLDTRRFRWQQAKENKELRYGR